MTTRTRKGKRIGRTPGSVRRLAGEVYAVAGDSGRIYLVRRDEETCECKDFQYQAESCKHLIAVEVFVADERRRERRTAATVRVVADTSEDVEICFEQGRRLLAMFEDPENAKAIERMVS